MLAVSAMLNVSVSSACLPALNNLVRPMFPLTIVKSCCSFRVPFVKLSPSNVMHAQAQAPNFKFFQFQWENPLYSERLFTSCILQHRIISTAVKRSAIVMLTPCESIRWCFVCKLSSTASAHVKVFLSTIKFRPLASVLFRRLASQFWDTWRGRTCNSSENRAQG